MTNNGRICLPSLKHIANNTEIVLSHSNYKEDPSLGQWVTTQRIKRTKLDSVRRDRLESIGFVWDAQDQQWENMFAKLEKYRQQHGDCLVPHQYKEDPSLGTVGFKTAQ